MISLAFASSTWIAAYAFEPSRTVLKPFSDMDVVRNRVQPVFQKILASSSRPARQMVKRLPILANANAERLTVSLAEATTFRAFIKPITFGGKLYLTYQFMKFIKNNEDEEKVVGRSERKMISAK